MQKTKHHPEVYFAIAALMLLVSLGSFRLNRLSAASTSGADTFKAKCAMCHGPDGGGKTTMGLNMKIRDLRSADVQKQTSEELAAIVTNGKPPMPAFGKTLDGADVHQIVEYLRSIATKS